MVLILSMCFLQLIDVHVVDYFLSNKWKWIIDLSTSICSPPNLTHSTTYQSEFLLGHCLSSPLLLQRLTLCKSQSHPLSHFDIPFGAMLYTRSFILVKTFGTKWRDAVGEAFGDKVVVKSVWFEPLVVASQTCFGWGNGWWNVSFVLK
jgi:hypothetical protein